MKTLILSIAIVVSAPWIPAQSESPNVVDSLQVLKEKRDFAMEAIKAKYFLDLKRLHKALTEANFLDEAKRVEDAIAHVGIEVDVKQSSVNSPASKFSEHYMVGSKWEYEAGGKKYLMVFERRTYKLNVIDSRGRKFVQLQREWKIENITGRRISTARGTVIMTLNRSLTEIKLGLGGVTAKLVGK